jgi:hypothetical protein
VAGILGQGSSWQGAGGDISPSHKAGGAARRAQRGRGPRGEGAHEAAHEGHAGHVPPVLSQVSPWPLPRTNWTRRVPHSVLSGHASPRSNLTRCRQVVSVQQQQQHMLETLVRRQEEDRRTLLTLLDEVGSAPPATPASRSPVTRSRGRLVTRCVPAGPRTDAVLVPHRELTRFRFRTADPALPRGGGGAGGRGGRARVRDAACPISTG